MLLSLNLRYNELMTHLPLGSLGHGGRDRHKSPQHIEPEGTESRGSNTWQYRTLNIGRLNTSFVRDIITA